MRKGMTRTSANFMLAPSPLKESLDLPPTEKNLAHGHSSQSPPRRGNPIMPLKDQDVELLRKEKEAKEQKNSHLKNFLQDMLVKAAVDKEQAAVENTKNTELIQINRKRHDDN